MNEHGCVSVIIAFMKISSRLDFIYFLMQREAGDWICPTGHSCQPLREIALEFHGTIGSDYYPSIKVSPILSGHKCA